MKCGGVFSKNLEENPTPIYIVITLLLLSSKHNIIHHLEGIDGSDEMMRCTYHWPLAILPISY